MIKPFVSAVAHHISDVSGLEAGHRAPVSSPVEISGGMQAAVPSGAEILASQLERLATDPARRALPLVAGSLELLGLDDVRQALGDEWDSVAGVVKEMAEAEIRAAIDPEDVCFAFGEASFLICFNGLDRTAATRRADMLAARIKAVLAQRLAAVAKTISVDQFVAEIDRASLRGDGVPLTDRLIGTLKSMRAEAKIIATRSRASLLRDFQLNFSPAWHTGKHVVVLNRCQLDMTAGCRSLAQFQALADPVQLDHALAELDCMLLTRALERLHRILAARSTGALLVPVSFKTVDAPRWLDDYSKLLQLMPKAYKRYLILEVSHIPDSITVDRLMGPVEALAPFAKGISLEARVDHPRMDVLLDLDPWGLALNLAGTSSTDLQLPPRLKRFAGAAAARGVLSLAHGANSLGLAIAASEAGFSYVDGPAVHPTLRDPKPPSPLNPLPPSKQKLRKSRW